MCGRFTLRDSKRVQHEYGVKLDSNYNLLPGQEILVVSKKIEMMKWSFSPSWLNKSMNLINARSETLHEKPSFKGAKRCVIPADGWYEWHRKDNKKQPYFFHNRDEVFLFAGIYKKYNNENGCALITKEANNHLQRVHHRMPVLLKYEQARDWLNGGDLFQSDLSNEIEYYPVSNFVNNPTNNNINCVAELAKG